MPEATLVVIDQCKCQFQGLDPGLRHRLNDELKFVIPNAKHMPSVKLGRWDGTVSFCSIGGLTYLNLLDRLLPLIAAAGYHLVLDDRRPPHRFAFPTVNETM